MVDENDNESSTLLRRLRRYSGVTGGLAGIALRGAGRLIGGRGPLDTANARDIARVMGAAFVRRRLVLPSAFGLGYQAKLCFFNFGCLAIDSDVGQPVAVILGHTP